MRARAIVPILLLIAIAIVAPIVIHARGRDASASLISFDDDPDMPVVLADGGVQIIVIIQRYVTIDLASTPVVAPTQRTSVLVMAPKTSPPLV